MNIIQQKMIKKKKKTLKPGKKKAGWLRTSELQEQQHGESLIFCLSPIYPELVPEGPTNPKHQEKDLVLSGQRTKKGESL